MRINWKQRIGIVASVFWLIGGGIWVNSEVINEAQRLTDLQVKTCVESNKLRLGITAPYGLTWKPCWDQFPGFYLKNVEGHWRLALLAGALPIPFAWVFAWIALIVVRWVKRGFDPN